MASVQYDAATRLYPGTSKAAVDELNLSITDGELLVLVGPSGSGKSTALRMLAGLEPLDAGHVLIGGKDVSAVRPRDRDIAMVFQNYALYPQLNVAANMGFALKQQGVRKEERLRRVREVAKLLDLEPYLDRKPRNLSGGQRQRVAMGRAIVRHPQVFLMDEPLSNLDAKLRVQMRADMAKPQRELGTTTIYVTHDQVEAMTMGDRVAVMSQGRLQQVDTPIRLYEQPANLFVAGFIGTPPMNLLEGTLHAQNGTVTVSVAGQTVRLTDHALSRYPGARGQEGRSVIVGVRSDDVHIATARPDLPTLPAHLELLEALGSETMAYYRVQARAVAPGAGGIEEAVEGEGD